jgi:hypothetical protein
MSKRWTRLLTLLIVALGYITMCAGMFLAVPFVKMRAVLGTESFLLVLSAVTIGLVILALLDLERLSAAYRRADRDLWFMLVKLIVLGFGGGVVLVWVTLFKLEILPFKYIWLAMAAGLVLALLVDRKERRRRTKKFRDVDELLRQERRS